MNYYNHLLEDGSKILVFGENGQIGQTFKNNNINNENIVQVSRKEVNFLKPKLISSIINDHKPRFIINTSAYTDVNQAELNQGEAFSINGEALKTIAESAKENNSILVHYSTDYIFDGKLNRRYRTKDKPNPLNIYGKSKLLGEQNIINSGCSFLIFRISWLMSEYGNNFIKTIISKIKTEKELFIVNDQYGSPISSKLVMQITGEILFLNRNKLPQKILHLSTKGRVTWYDIAVHVAKKITQTKNDLKINPVKSSHMYSKVTRPQNSLFDHSDVEKILNRKLPFWKTDINPVIKKLDFKK